MITNNKLKVSCALEEMRKSSSLNALASELEAKSSYERHLKYQEKRDYLYHISLTSDDNLAARFGDLKVSFVATKLTMKLASTT